MSITCPVCTASLEPGLNACPHCGFRLLGSTQEFKPIAIDGTSAESSELKAASALLRVIRGSQIGMSYKLTEKTSTLGRNPQCDIFLNDMTVSRIHARVEFIDGCHVIVDEHSYNGVWVNNCSIESKALVPGDHIQIGTFLMKYVAD